jgi:hypothetical protein
MLMIQIIQSGSGRFHKRVSRFPSRRQASDPTKVPKAAGGNAAVTRGVLKTCLLQRGFPDEDRNKARAKMSNNLNALAGKKVIIRRRLRVEGMIMTQLLAPRKPQGNQAQKHQQNDECVFACNKLV